jgi:2-polyprenyl-3-methyl-5-hydroxy-6-metoxy-1,4-benzoquinol methylase/uncharacterized protein YbaR (Trm112 family)
MKRSTLERLICPVCHGTLEVNVATGNDESVENGALKCSRCSQTFGIEEGVPRMFVAFDAEKAPATERFRVVTSVVNEKINQNVPAAEREGPLPAGKWHTPEHWKFVRVIYLGIGYLACLVGIVIALFGRHTLGLLAVGVGLVVFLADYLWYRWRERRAYQRHLLLLRQILQNPGQKSESTHLLTQMKPFHETIKDQSAAGVLNDQLGSEEYQNQRSLVNYKAYKVKATLSGVTSPGKQMLNIGCGGAIHIVVSRSYIDAGYEMTGLDYRQDHVLEFCSELKMDGVLGNALQLPFGDRIFDWVNCTDVIEHLLSPEQLAREIQRVLRPGGVLLMTTENATSFGFFSSNPLACFSLNPLILMERMLGTAVPKILPPREIIGSWGKVSFVHNQFSHQDLEELLRGAGFEIVKLETVFPVKKFEPLNKMLAALPFFKWMGYSLFTVARKCDPDGTRCSCLLGGCAFRRSKQSVDDRIRFMDPIGLALTS